MCSFRLTFELGRHVYFLQSWLGTVQLQVRVAQSQVRLGIIRTQLDGSLKILGCLVAFLQIIQHKTAVHVRSGNFRIQFQGVAEICNRFAKLARMNVDVTRD